MDSGSPQQAHAFLGIPAATRLAAICALLTLPLALGFFMHQTEEFQQLVLAIMRGRSLCVNIACFGGIIVLGQSLLELVRDEGYASTPRRIAISLFSGVVLMAVGIAMFLTPAFPPQTSLALIASVGAAVLSAQLAGAAVRNTREVILRITLFAGVVSVMFGATVIVLENQAMALRDPFAQMLRVLRALAEISWMLAPIPVLTDTRIAFERIRLGRAIGGWLLALLILSPILVLLSSRRETLAGFLTLTSHIGALSNHRLILLYPAFMLMTASLAMVQLVQRDPFRVHVGAAALFWLVGGSVANTPMRALMMVLFFVLLGRTARATKAVFMGASVPPPPPSQPPVNERLH